MEIVNEEELRNKGLLARERQIENYFDIAAKIGTFELKCTNQNGEDITKDVEFSVKRADRGVSIEGGKFVRIIEEKCNNGFKLECSLKQGSKDKKRNVPTGSLNFSIIKSSVYVDGKLTLEPIKMEKDDKKHFKVELPGDFVWEDFIEKTIKGFNRAHTNMLLSGGFSDSQLEFKDSSIKDLCWEFDLISKESGFYSIFCGIMGGKRGMYVRINNTFSPVAYY